MGRTGIRIAALLAAALLGTAAHAVMISFNPSATTVQVGDSFSVDIVVSDLGDVVSGFDLDVTFDDTLLAGDGASFGTLLGNLGTQAFADTIVGADAINVAEFSFLSNMSLDALQDDSVTLATLNFTALAAGIAELAFALDASLQLNVFGSDPFSPFAFDNIGTAQITIEAAPVIMSEPRPLALLAAGLILLAATRRGRRRSLQRI